MSRDLDIDEQELAKFIDVFSQFQDRIKDKFQSVESSWEKCNESWHGSSKDQFTKEFLETRRTIQESLDAGEDALTWLRRFDEVLKEFERQYR
ncbi:WXG100 family type VII secretion target [Microcystis aeruginosa]|jgi:uncharacterized protein YukE|uniref:Transcription termination factor NusA n=1 Tax=Microcystis aeruginosa NIES-3787 TaxID=2517782 RepID=A0A6H9GGT4_MICAE|nr:WXG100 family type VII secretion target [Microcystis aeruginosa]GCL46960.1 hypothetical protein NIES3787_26600 [Microcystis aeruginosa NIES-3787]